MNKKCCCCLLFLVVLLLVGCVGTNPMQNVPDSQNQIYGFWSGIWDGLIAVFAFIANVFGADYGIYQPHNNGNWYNFGFLIGVGAFTVTGCSRRR